MQQELPRQDAIPLLIEKLKAESEIYLSASRAKQLWARFEEGYAHFVVRDGQIVGCCVVWHDNFKPDKPTEYVELGTVWVQQQYKKSALLEIRDNIKHIAKGKKILGFSQDVRLARFFVMSPIFPVNSIANWKTCPPDLLESYQLEGWHADDIAMESRYTRVLYREDCEITAWYLTYEK